VLFIFRLSVDLGPALGLLCRRILFARSSCSRCFTCPVFIRVRRKPGQACSFLVSNCHLEAGCPQADSLSASVFPCLICLHQGSSHAVVFSVPSRFWARRSGSFTHPYFLPPLVRVPCSQLLAAPDLCSDFRVFPFRSASLGSQFGPVAGPCPPARSWHSDLRRSTLKSDFASHESFIHRSDFLPACRRILLVAGLSTRVQLYFLAAVPCAFSI
jgi:hypothetical protein